MSTLERWRDAAARAHNRIQAWRAARARPATAFVSAPEPRTVGSVARGRQLIAGNLMFAGHLVEAPGWSIWDVTPPDAAFDEAIHGCCWLDDLAAIGDAASRAVAQDWVWGWITRYGDGSGPGWQPELAGRRIIRWTHHALFLLRGCSSEQSVAYHRALGAQTLYVARRWTATRPGIARFEALTGLLYAGLSLEGMESHGGPARIALGRECARLIDAEGGLPTRNPEELLEVFALLTWAAAALEEVGSAPEPAHVAAIARIAPALRALRHSDGGLGRFHGGGRGHEGRLDQALAASGIRVRAPRGLPMGFARLVGGRTSVLIDAAPPPEGDASLNAHASTLAFELTSGRRPVVVSCGSGTTFGTEWRRAGRATPSHSALCLDGFSSARLGQDAFLGAARRERLEDAPSQVLVELSPTLDGTRFEGAHDGYVSTHGLTHARTLDLTLNGRGLVAEDLLVAMGERNRTLFALRRGGAGSGGVPFQIRFHLHPEVEAAVDMGGMAVSLALRSGEIWVLKHDSKAVLTLEPSVYLEKGRLRPRSTKQVVLSGRAMEYATRVRWSLSKAQETAVAIRDLAPAVADTEDAH